VKAASLSGSTLERTEPLNECGRLGETVRAISESLKR
jgi:hypothetical protein